jgi:hypothetical protein
MELGLEQELGVEFGVHYYALRILMMKMLCYELLEVRVALGNLVRNLVGLSQASLSGQA